MAVLDNLQPKLVFKYFEEISQIPRGSGNEKGISDYLLNFGWETRFRKHSRWGFEYNNRKNSL